MFASIWNNSFQDLFIALKLAVSSCQAGGVASPSPANAVKNNEESMAIFSRWIIASTLGSIARYL